MPEAFRCFLQKSYAAGDLTNREAEIRKAETTPQENVDLAVEILLARYGLTGYLAEIKQTAKARKLLDETKKLTQTPRRQNLPPLFQTN